MTVTMTDSRLENCTQLSLFLHGAEEVSFSLSKRTEKYQFAKNLLNRFNFRLLKKSERGMVRKYLQKMTGYSNAQTTRLVGKYLSGKLFLRSVNRHRFPTKYTPSDIALLVKTDNVHNRLNGVATRKILQREYSVFGKVQYQKISQISVSHIYNLRQTRQYQSHCLTFTKTIAIQRNIGTRRKPQPNGKPGYIRVDTVHQGDSDKEKGVYHINSVDEVTQWEIVAAVEKISEQYLEPILVLILEQYPFIIIEFHSDNGSEYINEIVAKLLNKLLVKLTKSRSRQTNDNALVESKNGSVIRKHMGYFYISQKFAPKINEFYQKFFNPYLNFHRPCGFAKRIAVPGKTGKFKKVYDTYQTPYVALKKIPNFEQFLKPGITSEKLDIISLAKSDNEAAEEMTTEKEKLFNKIFMNPVDF